MFNWMLKVNNEIVIDTPTSEIEGNASRQDVLFSEYNIKPAGWISIGVIATTVLFVLGIVITKIIKGKMNKK